MNQAKEWIKIELKELCPWPLSWSYENLNLDCHVTFSSTGCASSGGCSGSVSQQTEAWQMAGLYKEYCVFLSSFRLHTGNRQSTIDTERNPVVIAAGYISNLNTTPTQGPCMWWVFRWKYSAKAKMSNVSWPRFLINDGDILVRAARWCSGWHC